MKFNFQITSIANTLLTAITAINASDRADIFKTTLCHQNKMKKIAAGFLGILLGASTSALAPNSASASTTRQANAIIVNSTGKTIVHATILHKYSDVFKENRTWANLPNGSSTLTSPLKVKYNTGVFTTGKDWWRVQFKFANGKMCYTDPNNFREVFDAIDRVILTNAGAAGQKLGILLGEATGTYLAGPSGAVVGEQIGGTAGKAAANGIASALFNGEATVGFKQHILRTSDENRIVNITLLSNGKARISSPSGVSDTVYTCE
ncbi:hypothetical protein [Chamaesiphon polymorphus]|uniref:Up-regulated in Daf-2 domain-containing protein n=1 Tax=Chamaesiphon polymorphus CCALA 037 TaxID=2107692 RepID=A0A2T1FYP7_9CYAN|nr:hypothetical protein [Chamaesiphon polymorphus]PSB50125.1 hypothetical protein C7B77_23150 [Chamaesiphon polymorphus CCALA 037]